MNPSAEALRPEDQSSLQPAGSSTRRHHRRSKRSTLLGRVYLLSFFLVLRAYDAWFYLEAPDAEKRTVLVRILPAAIISTALLTGVWCRQKWARYILIALLFFRVAVAMVFLPAYIEPMLADPFFLFRMASPPVLDAIFAWVVIASPDIRRLASRNWK